MAGTVSEFRIIDLFGGNFRNTYLQMGETDHARGAGSAKAISRYEGSETGPRSVGRELGVQHRRTIIGSRA